MSKLDELADKALELKIQLDEITELYKEATADFIEQAKAEGKYDTSLKAAGMARVHIVPNRRFNTDKAQGFLTKKALKECEVTVIDPKALKARLTPLQVEEAMESFANPYKLSLSVLDD